MSASTILPPLGNLSSAPDTATLRAMTTEDLRQELGRTLEITAGHIGRLALVWRELEHRGENLSKLRGGLWTYMPLIASGRLRAELVVRYAGHSMLLRKLSELSDADQARLMQDDTVILIDHGEDGSLEERRLPITHLKAQQYVQLIAGGRIRPPEEQRRYAMGLSRRSRLPRNSDDVVQIARGQASLGGSMVRVALQLPMTAEERDNLQEAARYAGVPLTRLVRAALVKAGLLEERQ